MKQKSFLSRSKHRPSPSSSVWSWAQHLRQLPLEPGVYWFTSKKGEILYVGKASSLKARISSYKSGAQLPKTGLLLSTSKKLNWIRTTSELEAILTEAELIRIHQPRYNVRLKDDKSPLYIVMTKEDFPRVLTVRKTQLKDKKLKYIFGPYPSAYQTKRVLRFSRKIFPFCNAFQHQRRVKKACFYYHVGLCPGACTGAIDKKTYNQNLNSLKLFLRGKTSAVTKNLKLKMKKASSILDFESAAEIRDQILAIKSLTQSKFKAGFQDEYPSSLDPDEARVVLWKILAPFFAKNDSQIPTDPFASIEAYDVSNIQGQLATAALVVFHKGQARPSQYKRFKIRYIRHADDLLMLKETLTRRLRHKEWKLPNLIIIDGGKGQVRAARQALASFGLHHKIPIVGLAKRLEHLVVFKHKFHVLKLRKNNLALLLLMRIRDEAHRFARNYHLLLRRKSLTK